MNGCLKYGGILFILIGILIIVSGLGLFGSTADVASEQLATAQSDAEVLGTGIGAALMTGLSGGIGILGVIVLLVGIVAYFVGNSGMQKDKQLKLQEQQLREQKRH